MRVADSIRMTGRPETLPRRINVNQEAAWEHMHANREQRLR